MAVDTTFCAANGCEPTAEWGNGDGLSCTCIEFRAARSVANYRILADRMDTVELNFIKARTTRSKRLMEGAIGSVGGIQQASRRREPFNNIFWGRRNQSQFLLSWTPAAPYPRTFVS